MGRLSDIVLRGLQFEAQQEAQELENEGRRLQMDKIVQERVAANQRTKPGYAEAWDRITNPDVQTSEVGQYMARIPAQDIPHFLDARTMAQGNRIRNEFAMDKMMEEARQRAEALEQRLEQQRAIADARLQGQNIRHGEDIASKERIAGARVNLATAKGARDVAAAEEKGRKKYTPDDAVDAVARTVFKFPIARLTSDDVLSEELGGLDQYEAASIAQQAANEVIRLQEAGMTADQALQRAISGIGPLVPGEKESRRFRKDKPTVTRSFTRTPDEPGMGGGGAAPTAEDAAVTAAEDELLANMVEAAIAKQGEEIDVKEIIAELGRNGVKLTPKVAKLIEDMLPEE